MSWDTVPLIGLAALAISVVLAMPMLVRAWRLWRRGPPDFRADASDLPGNFRAIHSWKTAGMGRG